MAPLWNPEDQPPDPIAPWHSAVGVRGSRNHVEDAGKKTLRCTFPSRPRQANQDGSNRGHFLPTDSQMGFSLRIAPYTPPVAQVSAAGQLLRLSSLYALLELSPTLDTPILTEIGGQEFTRPRWTVSTPDQAWGSASGKFDGRVLESFVRYCIRLISPGTRSTYCNVGNHESLVSCILPIWYSGIEAEQCPSSTPMVRKTGFWSGILGTAYDVDGGSTSDAGGDTMTTTQNRPSFLDHAL